MSCNQIFYFQIDLLEDMYYITMVILNRTAIQLNMNVTIIIITMIIIIEIILQTIGT